MYLEMDWSYLFTDLTPVNQRCVTSPMATGFALDACKPVSRMSMVGWNSSSTILQM
jgi:hypothetical protein